MLRRWAMPGLLIGFALAASSPAGIAIADEPITDTSVTVTPDPVIVSGVTPLTVNIDYGVGTVIPGEVSLRLDTSRLRNVDVIVNHNECSRAGKHIACRWTNPSMHGLHIVFPLRRSLDSATGQAGTVTATVSSPNTDPLVENNSRTVAVSTVRNGVDLAASIAAPGRLTPGVNVPVVWSLTNRGPANATAVSVVFTAPQGAAFAHNSGQCFSPPDSHTAICSVGDIAAGSTVSPDFQITFRILASITQRSVGRAALIAVGLPVHTGPPTMARNGNYDSFTTRAGDPVSDLRVGASPASGTVGQTVTTVFFVWSDGPSDTPYTIRFTVPSGTEVVSVDDICAPESARSYRCVPTSDASGVGPALFGVISLLITAPTVGTDGHLTVTGTAQDPNTANNTVPINITVNGHDHQSPVVFGPGRSLTLA